MAYPISRSKWSRKKVNSEDINNGNEYIVDDDVSLEQLNAIVNNSLYASDTADTAISTANSALEQVVEKQGTVVTLEGEALSTWSADFAESERQKSKNLFNYNNYSSLNYGLSITGNNQFSINTQFYYTQGVYFISLQQGKQYTVSLNIDSYSNSDSSTVESQIVLFNADNGTQTIGLGSIAEIKRYSKTFVPSFDVIKIEIRPLRKNNNTSTLTGVVSNFMICEGPETDYQPYNGAIVHKKDIKPILIYDIVEKQTPTGLTSAYSSGIKFADGVNIPIGDFNYFNIYARTKNNVKKKTTINKTDYYWGDSFFGFNENWALSYFGVLFIIENNLLSMAETGYTAINTSTYTSKNQSEDVVVYRIEGGY